MKFTLNLQDSQIIERHLNNGNIGITIKNNSFHAGEINPQKDTFYNSKRTGKNLMKMFNNSLGINSHILYGYNFKYIVIPFENTILRTTRMKWIKEGVVSPYSNSKVDQQILMPFDKINMEDAEKYENIAEQLPLFEEVI